MEPVARELLRIICSSVSLKQQEEWARAWMEGLCLSISFVVNRWEGEKDKYCYHVYLLLPYNQLQNIGHKTMIYYFSQFHGLSGLKWIVLTWSNSCGCRQLLHWNWAGGVGRSMNDLISMSIALVLRFSWLGLSTWSFPLSGKTQTSLHHVDVL